MKKLTFRSCGLDISNNQLRAPICNCGCGGRMNMILKDDKSVADFIGGMLYEIDCDHCAIFAIKNNGNLIFGQKTDEDIICYQLKINNATFKISEMQQTFKFHCYGILQQVDETSWKIVMD